MVPEPRGLVGRERHVREIRLVLDSVAAGRGNLLVVAGEAGVGKSRLAEEALDMARGAGVATRWSTCFSGGAMAPLAPWRDVLGTDQPRLATLADADGQAARFQLFADTWGVVCAVAEASPTLFVLDDFHWADPLSVSFLSFAAPRIHSVPVALVAAYRDDEPGALDTVLPELVRHGRHLLLPALDRDEFDQFVAQLVPVGMSEREVEQLYARTGGNPLFARELIRLLDMGGATNSGQVPPLPMGVREVLRQRLQPLPAAARSLLAAAAVVGTEFGSDVLARVMRVAPDVLLEVLDETTRSRIVVSAGLGRWRFTHPLMQEVVYNEIGLARRVRLHQEVANALDDLAGTGVDVPASEVASHLVHAAAAGDAARAVTACERAGREALAALAYEDAARWFTAALEAMKLCPSDDARRADLFLVLGDSLNACGDISGARRSFSAAVPLARSLGSSDRLGHAALGVGSGSGGFEIPLFDRDQIELLEEALAAVPALSPLRARLLARLSVAVSFTATTEQRAHLAEAAIASAREVGEPSALGYALAAQCDLRAAPAHSSWRRQASTEIIDVARTLGDARLELLGRRLRLLANLELGDVVAADADIRSFATLADRLNQAGYSWYAPLWRGMRAAMDGRFTDTTRYCDAAAALGENANSENAAMLTASLRALALLEYGVPDAGQRFFREALERWPDLGVMTRPPLAYAEAVAGNRAAAVAVLDQVDLADYDPDVIGAEWLPALVMLADATWLVGGHRLAAELYEMLSPFRTHHAVDGIGDYDFGSVERPLGLLGTLLGRDGACRHFDAALSEHQRIGAALLVARTRRDAGQATDDPVMLTRAREDYERLAVPERVEEIDRLLAGRSPALPDGAAIHRTGATWTITYRGVTVHPRDTKGIADLAVLLAREGREVHALDLFAPAAPREGAPTGPVIDDRARRAYKQRLAELDDEIEEADGRGDSTRSARLQVERDALVAELASASGRGGRARRRGDPAERARAAVTQRIRDAIARLGRDHTDLGTHLAHSIKTGIYCAYIPERPVGWDVDVTT